MAAVNVRRIPVSDDTLFEMLKTMTYAEVSRSTGIKISTIQMSLTRHGYIKPKSRICPVCGRFFYGGKRKVYCSKQCKDTLTRTVLDDRITPDNIVDTDITLMRVYKRDGGMCYLCGEPTQYSDYLVSNRGNKICGPKHPSIDHVIPLSRGGRHSWDNVRLACLKCNRAKSNKPLEVVL